jgi:hypothetical protein
MANSKPRIPKPRFQTGNANFKSQIADHKSEITKRKSLEASAEPELDAEDAVLVAQAEQ